MNVWSAMKILPSFQNILHCILNHHRHFFCYVKENDKQSGNENNTNMNKGVIDNDGVGTD